MSERRTITASGVRRLLVITGAVSIGSVGVVLALMGTPDGAMIVSAGPLSPHHAVLADDCLHCHSASLSAFKGPFHGVGASSLSFTDSEKCLVCHSMGGHPMQAHSESSEVLAKQTSHASSRPAGAGVHPANVLTPPIAHGGQIACTTCHVEHEGSASTTALTDAQCQACHSSTFKGFGHGHPEFESYPYSSSQRIAFDHAAHINENFKQKHPDLAPTACTDCHTPDESGDFMTTQPFEQSCATCHMTDVLGTALSTGAGVEFFTLPAIDTLTLEDEGIDIGQWPADAAIAEGVLTPYMRMLLMADETTRESLEIFENIDLLDLQSATADELGAVAQIAWAIKEMAQDISERGHGALLTRSSIEGGNPVQRTNIAGGLPRHIWATTINAWLPNLESELQMRATGQSPPTDPLEDSVFEEFGNVGEEWASMGGWYRDDLSFSLRYRPTMHTDPFLYAWAEYASQRPETGGGVLNSLAKDGAVGECLVCHTRAESAPGSRIEINWTARRSGERRHALTRFRHAPHMPLVSDDGCVTCHKIGEPWEQPAECAHTMPMMSQTTCTECHNKQVVNTSCLGCHDYHAHRPTTKLPSAGF